MGQGEIYKVLKEQPHQTAQQISKKLGVTDNTVAARLASMSKYGEVSRISILEPQGQKKHWRHYYHLNMSFYKKGEINVRKDEHCTKRKS